MVDNTRRNGIRQEDSVHSDLEKYRELRDKIKNLNAILACLLVLQDSACSAEHLDVGFREDL